MKVDSSESSPKRDFKSLRYWVQGGVANVTFDQPKRLNAFSPSLYTELRLALRIADLDEAIDIIVIRGEGGRSFATGGDLDELLEYLEEGDYVGAFAYEDALPFETIRAVGKVVVSAVDGYCLAGGMVVALSSDLIIATERSQFGVPEGRVGLADSWVTAGMLGRVSLARIKYLTLTSEFIDAAEAERIGLINAVVADTDLDTAVDALVQKLRQTAPASRALYKEYINRHAAVPEAKDFYRSAFTPTAVEGLRAFRDQRPPVWQDGRPAG